MRQLWAACLFVCLLLLLTRLAWPALVGALLLLRRQKDRFRLCSLPLPSPCPAVLPPTQSTNLSLPLASARRQHAVQRRQGVSARHPSGGPHAQQVAGRPARAAVPS